MVGMMVDGGHLSSLPSKPAEHRNSFVDRATLPAAQNRWYIYRMVDLRHVDNPANP
jgi:hypothetical protein